MAVELFRRARRAEATAERAEDRRRLRLAFFRQALTQGFDSLKVRHAEGASGQESVRAHATLMDEVIFSLTRPPGVGGLPPAPPLYPQRSRPGPPRRDPRGCGGPRRHGAAGAPPAPQ